MGRRAAGAGTDAQRERILRAGAEVLADRGFDGARLRDVARAAEVSIGMLQHYFENRDELFRQAFAWSIDDLIDRWNAAAASESGPWRRFELLVEALTRDPDLGRRCATWTEYCASAARHPELRDGVRRVEREWHTLFSSIVEQGVRTREFAPVLPTGTAVAALVALVDGCDMSVAGRGGKGPERYAEVMLTTGRALLGVRDLT
jgi:AcrR family transcriptional regulator